MTIIPPNCVTRMEMQSLISKLAENIKRTVGEFNHLLHDLINAAAAIEGFLSDEAAKGDPKIPRAVLSNPLGWRADWFTGVCQADLPEGELRLSVGQQVLIPPGNRFVLGTNRRRVYVGNERVETTDPGHVARTVDTYMSRFTGVPDWIKDFADDIVRKCDPSKC